MLQHHLTDVATRINGYEREEIVAHFANTVASARAQLKKAVAEGKVPDPAKTPRDWHKDPWAYLYVDLVGADRSGKGSFDKLAKMLDYYQKMGVKNLYLLPHYESPMKDGGYDVSDHNKARSSLGGDAAFDRFMVKATAKGMRVAVDFIPGHTSEKHPLFKLAQEGNKEALTAFVHEPGAVEGGTYTAPNGEVRAKYVHKDGKVSDRLLIFPDTMKSNYELHQVGGKPVSFYSTFYPFQKDLNLQRADVLGMHMQTLGHWMSRGVMGIRADAIDFWVKLPGTSGSGASEAHAVAELFNAFTKMVNPKSAFLPEAVVGLEKSATYLGKPMTIAGTKTGSEANMTFGFEEAMVIKHAVATGDFVVYGQFMDRKRKVSLPEGTTTVLPIHKHDEWEMGFLPAEKRVAFREQIENAGGHLFKSGFSGGVRLYDLLGRNPDRMKSLFKFFHGHQGTPATYYGDEVGARNSWPHAWQAARESFEQVRGHGKLSLAQETSIALAFDKQDKTKPPQDLELNPFIDSRNVHRGPVSAKTINQALAGENQVYNRVAGLGGIRSSSQALRNGGAEEPLGTLRADIGSFMRRYHHPKTGRLQEEVAVVANPNGKATQVNLNLADLTTKKRFKLYELETKREVPFTHKGDHIEVSMNAHEVLWLRVDSVNSHTDAAPANGR